jgi:hypothetical protein
VRARAAIPALLALGLAAPAPAGAQTMAQMAAAADAAFARDRPAVEAFLAAMPDAAALARNPGFYAWEAYFYSWTPSREAGPQQLSLARFAALLAPCRVREIAPIINVITRQIGPPVLVPAGIAVRWTCAGPDAVAPALDATFSFDDGDMISVALRPAAAPAEN